MGEISSYHIFIYLYYYGEEVSCDVSAKNIVEGSCCNVEGSPLLKTMFIWIERL